MTVGLLLNDHSKLTGVDCTRMLAARPLASGAWSRARSVLGRPLNNTTVVGVGSASTAPQSRAVQAASSTMVATDRKTLEELVVPNTFTHELPGDSTREPGRRQVKGAFFSYVDPTPTGTEPYLVAASREMAEELGLDSEELDRPEFAQYLSGNAVLPQISSKTYAQCYGGHQFGSWAGQLGDGRAINLGEIVGPSGKHWEVQLKGVGRTPYSRTADGRAVLRSSLREFIGSEAMFHLGVPTTRALSLVGTGQQVMRDMFYNGNIKMEPGAVVCRVSPSFIRFGTFQLPASRGGSETMLVQALADYVIKHHYPHLKGQPEQYRELLREVSHRTAELVAWWQCVGFTHGVLNTDNMSILGETIDYGPYGFLEKFDPHYTPNTTDADGLRYTFRNQPSIGQWNLAQLATALMTAGLLTMEVAEEVVGQYADVLMKAYNGRTARKLGFREYDRDLSVGFMQNMYECDADFTNTWRALAHVSSAEPEQASPSNSSGEVHGMPAVLYKAARNPEGEKLEAWQDWLRRYRAKLRAEGLSDEERRTMQNAVNPAYIPRNQLMQRAITAAEDGDLGPVNELLEVLRRPYQDQPGREDYAPDPPDKIRPGFEMLSCSS